jgi:uncharacterized protein (DUF849 family)
MPDSVIQELAVNGSTPRSRNRHVPRASGEIAEVALAAVEPGFLRTTLTWQRRGRHRPAGDVTASMANRHHQAVCPCWPGPARVPARGFTGATGRPRVRA